GAVVEPADIAGPVDDREMAAAVDKPGVSGFQPAIRGDRLAAFIGLLVIALEDAGRTHLDFATLGDAGFHAGEHAADRFGIDFGVGLHRAQTGQFGRAVHLLQIHSEETEETENIDAERRAPGIDDAGAAQPELVAHRAVDEELADPAQQPQPNRYRPPLRDAELRPLGHPPEKIEDAALDR